MLNAYITMFQIQAFWINIKSVNPDKIRDRIN